MFRKAKSYTVELSVLAGLAALNFTDLLGSSGLPLAFGTAFLSCFSPYAYFLFIGGSQIVSDPAGSPLTIAQLGVLAWVVTLPWNGWMKEAAGATLYFKKFSPVIAWVTVAALLNGTFTLFAKDIYFGVLIGMIAAGYAKQTNRDVLTLLLWLSLGMSLSIVGYWGLRLGLPIDTQVLEPTLLRPETRIAGGRGDVNLAGMTIPVALWSLVSLIGIAVLKEKQIYNVIRLVTLAAFIFVLYAAASIATLSRTSLYQLLLGGFVFVLLFSLMRYQGPYYIRNMKVALIFCLFFVVAFMISPMFNSVAHYFEVVNEINAAQASSNGVNEMISGRAEAWGDHLKMITTYPLFGIYSGETWRSAEYGTYIVGGQGKYGQSHNTFLEFASLSGIPGMLLFIYVLSSILWKAYSRKTAESSAILVVALVMLLGMMGISAHSWKTFWVLMALIIYYNDSDRMLPSRSAALVRHNSGYYI